MLILTCPRAGTHRAFRACFARAIPMFTEAGLGWGFAGEWLWLRVGTVGVGGQQAIRHGRTLGGPDTRRSLWG